MRKFVLGGAAFPVIGFRDGSWRAKIGPQGHDQGAPPLRWWSSEAGAHYGPSWDLPSIKRIRRMTTRSKPGSAATTR
jgi:hypothetical protein